MNLNGSYSDLGKSGHIVNVTGSYINDGRSYYRRVQGA